MQREHEELDTQFFYNSLFIIYLYCYVRETCDCSRVRYNQNKEYLFNKIPFAIFNLSMVINTQTSVIFAR